GLTCDGVREILSRAAHQDRRAFFDALTHIRQVSNPHQFSHELFRNRLRRTRWREHSQPNDNVLKPFVTRLLERRDLWKHERPLAAGYGNSPQLSGIDQRLRTRNAVEKEMDLPGHEVDLGRPGTPVGHVNGADAGGVR